jgi:XTP/dITP diphosphohydrolase
MSLPRLVLATHNRHKTEEFKLLLGDLAEVVSLHDLNFTELIDETGTTFEDNALLKARLVFEKLNLPVLADDSGLEVDVLGGLPGVRSARFAGEKATDRENVAKLIKALEGETRRTARFVAVLALKTNETEQLFRGNCEGSISIAPSGGQGFGYDPIFIPEGFNQTFAELGSEVKNRLSHRAIAVEKLRRYLYSQVP